MLASPRLFFLVLLIPAFSNPAPVWDTIPRRQNAVVNHQMVFKIRVTSNVSLCHPATGHSRYSSFADCAPDAVATSPTNPRQKPAAESALGTDL